MTVKEMLELLRRQGVEHTGGIFVHLDLIPTDRPTAAPLALALFTGTKTVLHRERAGKSNLQDVLNDNRGRWLNPRVNQQ